MALAAVPLFPPPVPLVVATLPVAVGLVGLPTAGRLGAGASALTAAVAVGRLRFALGAAIAAAAPSLRLAVGCFCVRATVLDGLTGLCAVSLARGHSSAHLLVRLEPVYAPDIGQAAGSEVLVHICVSEACFKGLPRLGPHTFIPLCKALIRINKLDRHAQPGQHAVNVVIARVGRRSITVADSVEGSEVLLLRRCSWQFGLNGGSIRGGLYGHLGWVNLCRSRSVVSGPCPAQLGSVANFGSEFTLIAARGHGVRPEGESGSSATAIAATG